MKKFTKREQNLIKSHIAKKGIKHIPEEALEVRDYQTYQVALNTASENQLLQSYYVSKLTY